MAISKRLRYEILRRDNHTCRYCGASAPDVKMTVDHVTPTTLGGDDDPANLVAACADCNAGKSATPPTAGLVADVAQANMRWSKAMQLAADQQLDQIRRNEAERADMLDHLECKWTACWLVDADAHDTSTPYRHDGRRYAYRPHDWADSIDRMRAAGLSIDDLIHAMGIALRKSSIDWDESWRYFCGVAWSILRERQATAVRLLEAGDA